MTVNKIIIIGLKSAGKSTFAKYFAKVLGMSYFDTDHYIEDLVYNQQGQKKSFAEIYQEKGELYFRELEQKAVLHAMALSEGVVALGGSTLLNKKNLSSVRQAKAPIVYLRMAQKELWLRWQKNTPRFVKSTNVEKEFHDYYEKRDSFYQSIADYSMDVSHTQISTVADHILKYLKDHELCEKKMVILKF